MHDAPRDDAALKRDVRVYKAWRELGADVAKLASVAKKDRSIPSAAAHRWRARVALLRERFDALAAASERCIRLPIEEEDTPF